MDFTPSDEQRMLGDTLVRFTAEQYRFEDRAALIGAEPGFREEHWRTFADLGLLAATLPEEHGGLGGGPEETLVIMEQLGRALMVSPFYATVVLGATLLRGASRELQAALLPKVAAGELKLAAALAEPAARYELGYVETRARREGDGYLLDGHKCVVAYANVADKLIVSARTGGRASEARGLSLFLVDASAPGLAFTHYRTQDGGRASDVRLESVKVPAASLIGEVDGAAPLIEQAEDVAIAALCAESVGAMSALYEQTLEYLKTREQFGAKIGSFQALQHRMVDVFMHCELARSMALEATAALGRHRAERARAVSGAKVKIAEASSHVGKEAIQLHGGVGMTIEMPIGHYFKRITLINATLGDAAYHLKRYREMTKLLQAEAG